MNGKKISVLIVDPDPQEITVRLKELSPNFVFHHASSGKFALEYLADQCVDCVLLELDLKDMSGFQILHRIVPSPAKPGIAVIVWTRLTHPSLLLIAKQNGAQAALIKQGTSPAILHDAVIRAITAIPSVTVPLPLHTCREIQSSQASN